MRNLTGAFNLIRKYEGLRLHAYQDVVGVWTIGYGTTLGIHPGMVISIAEAEQLMESDVKHRCQLIESWLSAPATDNQICAMISLAYNVGLLAFHHSRLLTDFNAKLPAKIVAKDFMSWIHAGGKILPGLVKRRIEESELFLTGLS